MDIAALWQPTGITLALIALAEIGDKSQLVCMVLAARHRQAWPVLFGAVAAFGILNAAAVILGTALAAWLPEFWVLVAMAALFAVFGIHAFRQTQTDEDDAEISGHGLFATAFLMIFLAELGDKTQIAVVGLAGMYPAVAVWIGATTALALTSGIGTLAGKTLLRRLPMVWLHRLSGVLFLGMAMIAASRVLQMI